MVIYTTLVYFVSLLNQLGYLTAVPTSPSTVFASLDKVLTSVSAVFWSQYLQYFNIRICSTQSGICSTQSGICSTYTTVSAVLPQQYLQYFNNSICSTSTTVSAVLTQQYLQYLHNSIWSTYTSICQASFCIICRDSPCWGSFAMVWRTSQSNNSWTKHGKFRWSQSSITETGSNKMKWW